MTQNLLIDVSLIPQQLAGLEALVRGIAVAGLAFAVPLTIVDMNVKASGAKSPRECPTYQGFFMRLVIVVVCLLAYKGLFGFILKFFRLMCFAILSEEDWGRFLVMTLQGGDTEVSGWSVLYHSVTSIQGIVLVLSSLIAVTARDVIVMLQGCFLSILFAFGPIAVVCGISEKSNHITRGWFSNTIQVASWSFFLRLVVRVWLNLHPMSGSLGEGLANDFLGILTVNVTFLVLVLGTPLVAARLLSGGNLAAFGAAAFGAAQTVVLSKSISMGRFVSRETQQLLRAPEEEREHFFHHPIGATATKLYRSTFGQISFKGGEKKPKGGQGETSGSAQAGPRQGSQKRTQ